MKSKFLKINLKDVTRGILVAFMTAFLTGIIQILDNGAVFTWLTLKPILIAGVSAALSYILKCLMTNSRDEMFTMEHV